MSSNSSAPIPGKTTKAWPWWFRVGFPLVWGFLLYGHTLALPWSLIDDGLFYLRASQMNEALRAFDFSAFWNLLWTPEDNRFGPGLIGQIWLMSLLGGAKPWAWHLLKIFQFSILIMAMLEIVRLAGFRRLHAVVAVVAFSLIGRPVLFSYLQTHFANWQRLHTTDSHYIWLVMISAALFLRWLRPESRGRHVSLAGAGLTFGVAMLTKINVVAYALGALGALCLLAWRERGNGSKKHVVAGVVIHVSSIPGIFFFRPWHKPDISTYTVKFALTPEVIGHSVNFSGWLFIESWTYLLLLAVPWAFWRVWKIWKINLNELAFWILIPLMGLAAYSLQTGWPINLARYAVTYTPFIALVMGIFIGEVFFYTLNLLERKAVSSPVNWLTVSSLIGGLVIFLVCLPVYFWPTPTLLRFLPGVALIVAILFVTAIGLMLLRRKQHSRVVISILAGAFFGTILLQALLLTINTFDSAVSYTSSERALSSLLATAERMATSEEVNERPLNLQTNIAGEPSLQAKAFLEAFGWRDDVTIWEDMRQVVLEDGDRLHLLRREGHPDFRMIPPIQDGFQAKPLLNPEEEAEKVIMLGSGGKSERTYELAAGTRITGFELHTDTSSIPLIGKLELTLRNSVGDVRIVEWKDETVPRTPSQQRFAPLREALPLPSGRLTAQAIYTLPNGYSISDGDFAEDEAENGRLILAGIPYGGGDPRRFSLKENYHVRGESFVLYPPGSLLAAYYYGEWIKSPIRLGARRVIYDYEAEVYAPMPVRSGPERGS